MASRALRVWRGHRAEELARARKLVLADLVSGASSEDLHLGTYLLVMCSEFQAFCADLYAEAADTVRAALPKTTAPGIRDLVRETLTSRTQLGSGNPTSQNLVRDFDRVGVNLRDAWSSQAPPSARRDRDILDSSILRVRNELVHGNARLKAIALSASDPVALEALDAWRDALDRLAEVMDTVVSRELTALLGTEPPRGGGSHG